MTLDEAIAHCDEVAGACDTECRREHKQLADWLRELQDRRCYQGGNAAAMHKALVLIRDRVLTGGFEGVLPSEIVNICDVALAKPPRQCDVGTAEEQLFRHKDYCKRHTAGAGCSQCPLVNSLDCRFAWMQKPYKGGDNGNIQ